MASDADRRLGVWRALVLNDADPERAGRVLIRLPPELAKGEAWARLALPTRPRAKSEVLVAFEAGDLRRPYVLGTLWTSDEPPG